MRKIEQCGLMLLLLLMNSTALPGVIDPDCTAKKAATSAAMKASVGVGGRCDAAEAATDSAKRATGFEEKGAIEKHRNHDDDGLVKKAGKATKNAVSD